MQDSSIGKLFVGWAQRESSIHALVMFGSRAREIKQLTSADCGSDWDFHVVAARPQLFFSSTWTTSAGLTKPFAYVARPGRLGRITKVTGIFINGELDLIILPSFQLRLARLIFDRRMLRFFPRVRSGIVELATVLRPGHTVLKATPAWKSFFDRTGTIVVPERLSNRDICVIGEGYVCDYVSTRRKICRGEFLAAQRWLHFQLAECNFRLLHELRLRSDQTTFPDARRLEMITGTEWLEAVTVSAIPNRVSLLDAVEASAKGFRELMYQLVGSQWQWPSGLPLG
jgi:hypothetical protein